MFYLRYCWNKNALLKLKIFEVIRMRSSPNLKQQLKENMSFTIILFHEIMPDRVSFYILSNFTIGRVSILLLDIERPVKWKNLNLQHNDLPSKRGQVQSQEQRIRRIKESGKKRVKC